MTPSLTDLAPTLSGAPPRAAIAAGIGAVIMVVFVLPFSAGSTPVISTSYAVEYDNATALLIFAVGAATLAFARAPTIEAEPTVQASAPPSRRTIFATVALHVLLPCLQSERHPRGALVHGPGVAQSPRDARPRQAGLARNPRHISSLPKSLHDRLAEAVNSRHARSSGA